MTQQPLPIFTPTDYSPRPAVFPLETRDEHGRLVCHEHGEPVRAVGAPCRECFAVAVGLFGPTWAEGGA